MDFNEFNKALLIIALFLMFIGAIGFLFGVLPCYFRAQDTDLDRQTLCHRYPWYCDDLTEVAGHDA
jgi:hypothetical protein